LAGCDEVALIKKFTPIEDEAIARKYLSELMEGNVDEIQRNMEPSLVDSDTRATLLKMSSMLPQIAKSTKVVGVRASEEDGRSIAIITFECEFQDAWDLVNVAIENKAGARRLVGLNVKPIADSLENYNQFSLVGKSASQYLVLALALFCLLFSFYSLLLCIRTKKGPTRWMWISIILIGVGKVVVNWTTGEWAFTIWAIQAPCASAAKSLYGPWMIGAYFPLGAIIFLNERWKDKVFGRPSDHDWPRKGFLTP